MTTTPNDAAVNAESVKRETPHGEGEAVAWAPGDRWEEFLNPASGIKGTHVTVSNYDFDGAIPLYTHPAPSPTAAPDEPICGCGGELHMQCSDQFRKKKAAPALGELAKKIFEVVESDINGRRSIGWEGCDDDIQNEIREELTQKIAAALSGVAAQGDGYVKCAAPGCETRFGGFGYGKWPKFCPACQAQGDDEARVSEDPIRNFGARVFRAFFGDGADVGSLDGADLQELAIEAKLLREEAIETDEGCGEGCNCIASGAGAGDTCYRMTVTHGDVVAALGVADQENNHV